MDEERTNDPQSESGEADRLPDLEIADEDGQSIKGGIPKQPDSREG